MNAVTFPLTKRFTDALQLAHKWHVGQYRKGTLTPYLSHLLGVASVALEFGATENEAIAALLHDALEDGPENLTVDKDERADVRRDLEAQVLEIWRWSCRPGPWSHRRKPAGRRRKSALG